jgi:hypothetical protein
MSAIPKRHRKKPIEIQRSPRGLLTNVSKYSRDQKRPGTRQQIADCILSWRQFAAALIDAPVDKKPEADVLDRARAAAQVLKQLDRVETYLMLIERNFADRSGPILTTVHAALLLATRVHQLTIVDNEIDIVTTEASRRRLKDNRTVKTNKAKRKYREWQAMADELLDRHPGWSKSVVAKEITKTDPSAKVGTIRRQITKRK